MKKDKEEDNRNIGIVWMISKRKDGMLSEFKKEYEARLFKVL